MKVLNNMSTLYILRHCALNVIHVTHVLFFVINQSQNALESGKFARVVGRRFSFLCSKPMDCCDAASPCYAHHLNLNPENGVSVAGSSLFRDVKRTWIGIAMFDTIDMHRFDVDLIPFEHVLQSKFEGGVPTFCMNYQHAPF